MKSLGALIYTGPLGTTEFGTITCCHCNAVQRAGSGGRCTLCNDHICSGCCGKECTPFEQRMDMHEKRSAERRRLQREMGLVS